jgi:hypothetical protein
VNEMDWKLLEEHSVLDHIAIGGVELRPGDQVRLRPRPGGDIFDMALRGEIATIESIEQDYESKQYVAVTLNNDPGRDLGLLRQPGHRFFFAPEELEVLSREREAL